ncbi:hypothetical protein [Sunxiuqinia dokdonensis]|uniref:DUF5045 domain-containing protein n=1 Tax=Sunxiuqinia dokdonensis TaxID=1409788 RepID=A0A0L8V7W8_9BACT|nr:hypothetical protein [Sunxiuqinia dokdonensis]KOH44580.1 hypothetical protein NC99_25650 [Sunxiuqinia dokdonensis]
MKLIFPLLGMTMSVMLATAVFPPKVNAQLLNVKPWHGYYPEMNGSYPLSFVAFKGWLFPVPHVFVRTWPTHYYVEVGALPVSDAEGYADLLRINLMKIVSRLIEKSQMKDRHDETAQIKVYTQEQKEIEKLLFDSRSDELPDVYDIAGGFIRLYESINRLDKLENRQRVKQILEKEADGLLSRFISVNLLQTDHGQKLEAFSEIRGELSRQTGDADYTYRKVHHYQFHANNVSQSYSFLTH